MGSRERKGRKKNGMRAKRRLARFKVGPSAPSSCAARDDHAPVSTSAPSSPLEPRTASPHLVRSFPTLGMSIWTPEGLARKPRQIAQKTVTKHGNRENPSEQKSSHLFFVQRSLYQETSNKEGATVITPFLPTGFSRESARKTGQPGPSQHDPTKPRHIKYSHEEGPGHISQGLTKFD